MKDLIEALKQYKTIAIDMAEFAREGHLEATDKLQSVIELQQGALAVLIATQDAVAVIEQLDCYQIGDLKLITETCKSIKVRTETLTKTDDMKSIELHYEVISRMYGRLIEHIFERESDSEGDWKFRNAIDCAYFKNEVA